MAGHSTRKVLPGFGLTLGVTIVYLSLVVLIPLAAVFVKTATLSADQFWTTISAPRAVASYQLTFGAALLAALVNAVFGLILAWARVRTGALWFSIGLHAGWIFTFKGFNKLYQDVPNHPLQPWGVGEDLRSGFLPVVTLLATALICHFVLRLFEPAIPPVRPTAPD